jgi:hypothetical protein
MCCARRLEAAVEARSVGEAHLLRLPHNREPAGRIVHEGALFGADMSMQIRAADLGAPVRLGPVTFMSPIAWDSGQSRTGSRCVSVPGHGRVFPAGVPCGGVINQGGHIMKQHLSTTLGILAALVATGAFAASPVSTVGEPAGSADVPHTSNKPVQASLGVALAGPTVGDVGDVDSFGRNLTWLGLAGALIQLEPDCTGITGDCQTLAPPPALTSFSFPDIAHISLPAKATHSLLCYWFSPFLTVTYNNPTAAPVVARLNYSPTLTVENSVLSDPSLIDPTTGLPFGGQLLTGMTSSEHLEIPLPAGLQITERTRDSAVCIAGLLSRAALVDTYGLTDAQAKEFFKRPTTIRLNVNGTTQYVDNAALNFGLRIVGD